jgi:hypothetical protein
VKANSLMVFIVTTNEATVVINAVVALNTAVVMDSKYIEFVVMTPNKSWLKIFRLLLLVW